MANLKIATWNLARPTLSNTRKKDAILAALRQVNADILVLTETNSCIDLSDAYTTCFQTAPLFKSLAIDEAEYKQGENRVTIWSKFPGRRRIDMCNSHSAICAELSTSFGKLNVYGTVIGIYGKNRGAYEPANLPQTDFETTLEVQLSDWERLNRLGDLCIAGDFNQSLGSNYYFTERHRRRLLATLKELKIEVPTATLADNIDQIAISRPFLNSFAEPGKSATWHESRRKAISDHQGVSLTLERA
jgi:endonuclease/exonuclease/phosphatase family metal-dependent hydrolase